MKWQDARKDLMKDWTLRDLITYWITFKIETLRLKTEIWWKGKK